MPAPIRIVLGLIFVVGGWFLQTKGMMIAEMFELNFGVTVAMIGMLLIMFPLVSQFYTRPFGEMLDTRNRELEQTFKEAEDLRSEMTALKSDYEKRLAATEADARERIQAQIKEAQELRKTLMSEASSKADEFVKRAQDEIAAERDRALSGIRMQVANLTLQATEKVLSENMDNERNRKLIDEFLDKVEVPTA